MQYLSILRGINVGGHNKIKMTDLQACYTELGFTHVRSYIQSGNVLFHSDRLDRKTLITNIEHSIQQHAGFSVPVQLLTLTQLQKIMSDNPFDDINLQQQGANVLVTVFDATPSPSAVKALLDHVRAPERCVIKDSWAYLYCPNGYGRSKLNNTFFESKLALTATTRNWKTLTKLLSLASETTNH